MLHATFEDGSTMLFSPDEIVLVCDDVMGGEYIVSDHAGRANDVVVPGVFVLDKADSESAIPSETKIVWVRWVDDPPEFRRAEAIEAILELAGVKK